MKKARPINFILCIVLSVLMLCLTVFNSASLDALGLDATKVHAGELWRIITANFVHFGWAHTLMNIAAFLVCYYAFFSNSRQWQFIGLIILCCVFVGTGILYLNPYYAPYAGLSGAIHGLIAAGVLLNREYPLWIRWVAGLCLTGKVMYENSGYFEATDLQKLIDAQVAVESHLYGAIGGTTYALIEKIVSRMKH